MQGVPVARLQAEHALHQRDGQGAAHRRVLQLAHVPSLATGSSDDQGELQPHGQAGGRLSKTQRSRAGQAAALSDGRAWQAPEVVRASA